MSLIRPCLDVSQIKRENTVSARNLFAAFLLVTLGACSTSAPRVILPYSDADVPKTLFNRTSTFQGSGLNIVVEHSLGHSVVSPSIEMHAGGRYVEGGRGAGVPYYVHISMPKKLSTLNPEVHRKLALDTMHELFVPVFNPRNEAAAKSIAKEVMAKTYCRGGQVRENRSEGKVAVSQPVGGKYTPGWSVKLRCTRWRLR